MRPAVGSSSRHINCVYHEGDDNDDVYPPISDAAAAAAVLL